MLHKLKQQKSEGFTIIEVLIVLAIAGLIMLVVFLAVPALQRNSRNTQRKSDVSALLGAVQEYVSNNSGSVPTTAAQVTALAKTGFYQGTGTGSGQINIATGAQSPLGGTSADDRVVIVTGAACDTATAGKTIAGAARGVAIQYEIEASGGTFTAACQQS